MPLPRSIALPTDEEIAGMESFCRDDLAACVIGSAESLTSLGIKVVRDPSLKHLGWASFAIEVDGVRAGIEVSDFPIPDPASYGFAHWFMFNYTSALVPYRHLAPFGPCSFSDWSLYDRLRPEINYQSNGIRMLNNQTIIKRVHIDKFDGRNLRRWRMLEMLSEFGDRVDVERTGQEAFLRKLNDCLCYVHSPGSWLNQLDRTPVQVMALGGCVVQPEIHCYLGDIRPRRGIHYLACEDDYSDIPAIIRWCDVNRDRCREIGAAAKRLFGDQASPSALWSRVRHRLCHAG